ncbi:MAG TPA: hypothetical protein VIL24_05740 [Clostridia bacterium]
MGYAKKILILNEITKGFGIGDVRGVATIEKIGDRANCDIQIFNLKDVQKGIFAFGVASDTSPVYTQRLGNKGKISATMPLGDIELKGNLYCVLCYISDENIIPIAWGANNARKLWETNILDGFKHIMRPAMFAGAVEKVDYKKESLTRPQESAHSRSQEGVMFRPQESAHPRPQDSVQPKASQSSVQYKVPPYAPKSELKDFLSQPLSVPKITVAKISKVIDEAEKEYNDSQISQESFYPKNIKPRDILEESAAASQAVQEAMSKPGFYKAFEQVPKELVDEYDDQESYIKNKFASSFYKKPEPQEIKQEPKKEQDDLFRIYYYQDYQNSQEQGEEFEPTYIKSWGGYNNIKPKEPELKEQEQEPQESNDQPKYYLTVKDQLEKLFENNPPEEKLNSLMPDTYWVRVEIGPNQYYVVGLIGEGPDYIGYGVPGVYSVNPPKELQGYCKWLALDKNNPKGEGYWMMYQDAESGQSINLDLI